MKLTTPPFPLFPSFLPSTTHPPSQCTTTEDGQGYDTYPLNTINSLNKTHSDKDTKDKFADQDTVTLHSSKLWPQTWKPR